MSIVVSGLRKRFGPTTALDGMSFTVPAGQVTGFVGRERLVHLDLVRLATILFAAGQETTVRLLLAGMRFLCEQPTVAEQLRRDPEAIPNFIEECLRLESPIKGSFRLALHDTSLAGVPIDMQAAIAPPGQAVEVTNGLRIRIG